MCKIKNEKSIQTKIVNAFLTLFKFIPLIINNQ